MFYILKDKKPVEITDPHEWNRWFMTDERIVARTEIGKITISTVFLGTPHLRGMFETMIFGGVNDEYQTRCDTWEEAEKQHEQAVALVRRTTSSSHRTESKMPEIFLTMWVVYDHPTDFPENWVVRPHHVYTNNTTGPSAEYYLADTLDEAREAIPGGLYRLDRFHNDDPCIHEVWL